MTACNDDYIFEISAFDKQSARAQPFAERTARAVKPKKRNIELPCTKTCRENLVLKVAAHDTIEIFCGFSRYFQQLFDGHFLHFRFGKFIGFFFHQVVFQNILKIISKVAFAFPLADVRRDVVYENIFLKYYALFSFFHKKII